VTSRRPVPLVRRLALLTLLVPTAGIRPLVAQSPTRLSLDEALELARRSSPTYLSARNDLTAADWEVRAAVGQLLTPSASVSGSVGWQGTGEQRLGAFTLGTGASAGQPTYLLSSYGVNASYQLSGSTLLAPSQARAGRDATASRIRAEESTLVLEVTRRYLDALRQDDGVTLARQELERADFNVRLARARTEVGSGTPLDERQAEVALGRARVALLQAETAARTARIRLLAAVGVDPSPELELTSRFEISLPTWDPQGLVDYALQHNPGIQGLRSSASAADIGVRSARSSYFPSLSVQFSTGGFTRQVRETGLLVDQARAGAESSYAACLAQNDLFSRLSPPLPPQDCSPLLFTDETAARIRGQNQAFPLDFTRSAPSATLSVSLPVFQGLNRQRQLEAAKVSRDDARLRVRQEEIRIRAEVAAGLATVEAARATALLEEENALVADEQLRLAQEQYRVGTASFLQLVEAETLKARADRERLNAVFTFHEALAALESLVGASLRSR
jgi:outer membrane protein